MGGAVALDIRTDLQPAKQLGRGKVSNLYRMHVCYQLGNKLNDAVRLMYPTGQNDSLELMFAKFATAKNREKLHPLKVSSNGCYLPVNNIEGALNCSSTGTRTTVLQIPNSASSPTHYD